MKSQPVRRHHNNEGRGMIKHGHHERALQRVAARLGVPYGKDRTMLGDTREHAAHLVLGDQPQVTMLQGATLRCHPWVAAAMEAKDVQEARHLAEDLAKLLKGLPAGRYTWRGYTVEIVEAA